MAWEIPGFSWTREAGEDLSDSQYCGVDLNGDSEVVLPTQGGRCIGVIRNKPLEGEAATIVTTGIVMVKVGATGIQVPNNVTVDDDGTIIQAASGDQSIGVALEDNAAGEIGTVLLLIGQSVVAGS